MSLRSCARCGWSGQPRRLWCPECGHGEWLEADVQRGRVVAMTRIRRAAGAVVEPGIPVCLVRLDRGEHVIAAAGADIRDGDEVSVAFADGALRARR